MHIDSLDHLVLTVRDIEATCDFYSRVLGMQVVRFGGGSLGDRPPERKALTFGTQKINLHQLGWEFRPNATVPTPGSADLCFLTSVPISQVIRHITACGIAMLDGPVERTGATGLILSVYFRDPDGNLIEVSNLL